MPRDGCCYRSPRKTNSQKTSQTERVAGGGEEVGNRNTLASKNSLHKELHNGDEEQWHMRENDESDPISVGVFENCSNRLFASDSD